MKKVVAFLALAVSACFLQDGAVTARAVTAPSCKTTENWYVIKEYVLLKHEKEDYRMRIVARVYDKETCYYAAATEPVGGEYARCVSGSCVSGREYDEALDKVFKKQPLKEAYIALIDKYGYETVVDFLKVPPETINILAEEIAEWLKKQDGQNVSVIYPAKPIFTIGDSSDHIKNVQGVPTSVVGNVWFYDTDMVVFDSDSKVTDYSNFSGRLKVE